MKTGQNVPSGQVVELLARLEQQAPVHKSTSESDGFSTPSSDAPREFDLCTGSASACSAFTTAVAITRGTGGQNRVGAALPPVLCLSYASPRSMGSQTELRQSTICMQ